MDTRLGTVDFMVFCGIRDADVIISLHYVKWFCKHETSFFQHPFSWLQSPLSCICIGGNCQIIYLTLAKTELLIWWREFIGWQANVCNQKPYPDNQSAGSGERKVRSSSPIGNVFVVISIAVRNFLIYC
jgi:hypothetical protein